MFRVEWSSITCFHELKYHGTSQASFVASYLLCIGSIIRVYLSRTGDATSNSWRFNAESFQNLGEVGILVCIDNFQHHIMKPFQVRFRYLSTVKVKMVHENKLLNY